MTDQISSENVEIMRGLVSGDDDVRLAALQRLDDKVDPALRVPVWLMILAILDELLRDRVRQNPTEGTIRFVADLRIRHSDKWAADLRPRPMEDIVAGLLRPDLVGVDHVAEETRAEIMFALLMMLTDDAELEPAEADALVKRAKVAAQGEMHSPTVEQLLATLK